MDWSHSLYFFPTLQMVSELYRTCCIYRLKCGVLLPAVYPLLNGVWCPSAPHCVPPRFIICDALFMSFLKSGLLSFTCSVLPNLQDQVWILALEDLLQLIWPTLIHLFSEPYCLLQSAVYFCGFRFVSLVRL